MTVDQETYNALVEILEGDPWHVRKSLLALLSSLTITDTAPAPQSVSQLTTDAKNRTDSQHRALFLWFGMIEEVCANQGVTADMLFRHTAHIAITKNVLHEMCKTLMKALWGIGSTKELAKQGHIEKLIDHFTVLFAKEGVELPPFPSNDMKNNIRLAAMENLNNDNYPEFEGAPEF